ncbi:hypothetical protein ABD71_09335 [Brevibacillus laterosporus]|nr:helix-turn-helix transcriptional regulator [Brevibacillus laterosporus]MBG9773263.1 hypothetical protein [Brevibacillus laterosporus]
MIGEEIKKFRENNGLDHKALSNLTGIDKSVIWKIETGQTRNPKYKTIREITKGLRIPFAVIIENFSTDKPDEAMSILTDALNQENPYLIQEASGYNLAAVTIAAVPACVHPITAIFMGSPPSS